MLELINEFSKVAGYKINKHKSKAFLYISNKTSEMEMRNTLVHCWWDCKLVRPIWKSVWRFLGKLGMDPPFDPAIVLLGLFPEDLKRAYYRDTATSMIIVAQFTIARLWNQPRCPSIDEWIKKTPFTHNGVLLCTKK